MDSATPTDNRVPRRNAPPGSSHPPTRPRPPLSASPGGLARAHAAVTYAWDSAREVSYAPAIERRGIALDAARRWLPYAVPVALAAVVLAAALVIARSPHGRAAIPPARFWPLAGVLLLAGAPLAVALKRAGSDAAWVGLLGLGAAVDVVLAVAVLAGARAALVALLIVAAVGGALVYSRLRWVEAETAVITTLAGQHSRTLLPALHILLPGERVLVTLPTGTRTHATLPQRVTTPTGARLQASARMRYRLIAEQAHRAIHADAQWERTLHRLLAETVTEELARGASDVEWLRGAIERLMRGYGLTRGIRVEWVRLEAVVVDPALNSPALPPAATAPATTVPAALAPTPTLALATTPLPGAPATRPLPVPPAPPAAAIAPTSPQPPLALPAAAATEPPTPVAAAQAGTLLAAGQPESFAAPWWERPRAALRELGAALNARLPGARQGGGPAGDNDPRPDAGATPPSTPPAEPAPLPSADVLTAAYEAIREGRINDPTTVRHVAGAFTRLAESGQLGGALEFDPERAAQVLLQHAQMLDDPSRAPDSAADEHQSTPAPQSPPRDDNVIRGG